MCPCRVLVVDDNADMRESLVMILELLGHHAEARGSGEQALQLLEEAHRSNNAFSLAIVDVGMPTMSGYEFAAAIRLSDAGQSLTLAACTGRVSAEDRQRATSAGFDVYLTKPIDMQALRNVLGRLENAP